MKNKENSVRNHTKEEVFFHGNFLTILYNMSKSSAFLFSLNVTYLGIYRVYKRIFELLNTKKQKSFN